MCKEHITFLHIISSVTGLIIGVFDGIVVFQIEVFLRYLVRALWKSLLSFCALNSLAMVGVEIEETDWKTQK